MQMYVSVPCVRIKEVNRYFKLFSTSLLLIILNISLFVKDENRKPLTVAVAVFGVLLHEYS